MKWEVGKTYRTRGGWNATIESMGSSAMSVLHEHPSVGTFHRCHNLNGERPARYLKELDLMADTREIDLRSPIAKARDAFFESPKGQSCLHGSASGIYLRNRIEAAFLAGMREGSRMQTAKILEVLRQPNTTGEKL